MKKDILKIAGVKSEKEFYKKFPTEDAFMAKHGGAFHKARRGNKLSKADLGSSLTSLDSKLGSMGGIGGASGQLLGGIQTLIEEGKQRKKSKQALAISDVTAQAASSRPVGLERKYVRPEDMLVNPGETGSPYGTGMDFLQMENGGFIGGNPTEIQNMYNPGDLYSDLGYEPLNDSNKVKQFRRGGKAQFGNKMNPFPSGVLERNLPTTTPGIQQLMSFRSTGTTTTMAPSASNMNPTNFGQIGGMLGSFAGGGTGEQSGASQVGSAVGSVAGNILLPGVGGVIGGALGGLVGGAIGARGQKTMQQRQARTQANLGSAAFQQSLQGPLSANMEDGGELKYLSHNWQPQTITKFGEYDMKDLLAPPKDADMLRAGGHLREYTPPSAAAMSTERPMMQMGGELETYWGGYAEPISQNPYLPDGGETVMFRGQSHDESDGRGRTGIGISFGNGGKPNVEVEDGEPAIKLKDGGTGEDSLVVFGNMKIPSYGLSELNDPKAKGLKFKRYAADLSKMENKANKTSQKAQSILENTDGNSPFDLLSMSTANIMMKGSDMKLKDAANKKKLAAGIQSAILDTAEEMGLENDALAKGKIKRAKGGGKFASAQMGTGLPTYTDMMLAKFGPFYKPLEEVVVQEKKPTAVGSKSKSSKNAATAAPIKINMAPFMPTAQQDSQMNDNFFARNPQQTTPPFDSYRSFVENEYPVEQFDSLTKLPTAAELAEMERKKPGDKFDLLGLANQLNPHIRPLIQNPLDPGQFSPEMLALSTNNVDPVYAQKFSPLLEQTSTVSFQDQLNEIQAEANAARRLAGNNPSAQSAIAAQAANAKNKVLGEQFRTNTIMQLESRRKNLATLNEATLKNLGFLDEQFVRQSKARSATKAQAQTALNSIADKIAKNKADTLEANIMSNMYPQYTFGPKGRIYNTGPTSFNIPTVAEEGTKAKKNTARNGSIVKAIKNL
jgi:hypothetical protein